MHAFPILGLVAVLLTVEEETGSDGDLEWRRRGLCLDCLTMPWPRSGERSHA